MEKQASRSADSNHRSRCGPCREFVKTFPAWERLSFSRVQVRTEKGEKDRGRDGGRKIEVVNVATEVSGKDIKRRFVARHASTRNDSTPTVSLSFAQIHTPLAGCCCKNTVSTRVACFNGKCVCPDASTTSVHRSILAHTLFHSVLLFVPATFPRSILVQPVDLFSRHEHSGTIVEEGRVSGRGDESNWHRAASFLHLLQPHPSVDFLPPLSSASCHSRVTLSPSACFFNAKCSLLFARVYGRFGRGDRPAGEDFFQMLNARFVPTHLHVCHQLRVPSTGSHRTRKSTLVDRRRDTSRYIGPGHILRSFSYSLD